VPGVTHLSPEPTLSVHRALRFVTPKQVLGIHTPRTKRLVNGNDVMYRF
jgi:hypothetical protein